MTDGPQVENLDAMIARMRPQAEAARARWRRRMRRAIVGFGIAVGLIGLGLGLLLARGVQQEHRMRLLVNHHGPR
jgi:hypothetical protein